MNKMEANWLPFFINPCAEKYYFFLKKDINSIKFKNMRLI